MKLYEPGTKIGEYRVDAWAGGGGYGTVYVVTDFTGKKCALKLLYPLPDGSRNERELDGLRRYRQLPVQTNLLSIFHIGEWEGLLYYTMELADDLAAPGEPYRPYTLGNRLRECGRLSPDEVYDLGLALSDALRELHRNHLVHKDIKPDNIIFVNGIPKLADIGLLNDNERSQSLLGTIGYIPPEVFVDRKSSTPEQCDIFALSKVLYCAMTGYDADRFPELPCDLPLNECTRIFRQALLLGVSPSIRNIEEFRTELLKRDKPFYRKSSFRKWTILGLLLLLTGLIAVYKKTNKNLSEDGKINIAPETMPIGVPTPRVESPQNKMTPVNSPEKQTITSPAARQITAPASRVELPQNSNTATNSPSKDIRYLLMDLAIEIGGGDVGDVVDVLPKDDSLSLRQAKKIWWEASSPYSKGVVAKVLKESDEDFLAHIEDISKKSGLSDVDKVWFFRAILREYFSFIATYDDTKLAEKILPLAKKWKSIYAEKYPELKSYHDNIAQKKQQRIK